MLLAWQGLPAVFDFSPGTKLGFQQIFAIFTRRFSLFKQMPILPPFRLHLPREWRGNEVDQNRVKCFTVFPTPRVEEVGHRIFPGLDLTHLPAERIYDRGASAFSFSALLASGTLENPFEGIELPWYFSFTECFFFCFFVFLPFLAFPLSRAFLIRLESSVNHVSRATSLKWHSVSRQPGSLKNLIISVFPMARNLQTIWKSRWMDEKVPQHSKFVRIWKWFSF